MAMVICATIITALLAVIAGYMGSHLHLGFTVISRRSRCTYNIVQDLSTDVYVAHGVYEERFGR